MGHRKIVKTILFVYDIISAAALIPVFALNMLLAFYTWEQGIQTLLWVINGILLGLFVLPSSIIRTIRVIKVHKVNKKLLTNANTGSHGDEENGRGDGGNDRKAEAIKNNP